MNWLKGEGPNWVTLPAHFESMSSEGNGDCQFLGRVRARIFLWKDKFMARIPGKIGARPDVFWARLTSQIWDGSITFQHFCKRNTFW